MIEVPESYVLVKQINQVLKGKVIKHAEANHSPHAFAWYTGNIDEYQEKLFGKTITSADVHGGTVRIRAEDVVMIISTPIRFHRESEKLPQKHQLYIQFEDSTSITCAVQMWGCMFCFNENDPEGIPQNYVINNNNPSPLEDMFDEEYFKTLLKKEKLSSLSAKAFLTTEQRITGLANGSAQDILWNAKIHPKRKMSTLSEDELKEMYKSLKSVVTDMMVQGGRDTERDLFGNPGGYKTVLSKKTVGKPCPICNTIIRKEAYLGGSIYYCPSCQKL
ncbi:endonuclease VIII [Desnuesiella massiliensis]|uniref:endonuclease VIII n=1 Tax=Desnuesiella massiliensis TaxID=1650662 RepID=UPI0006E26B9A|nr:endonuclease VIII [Desnuesiella massiliensis]